MARTPREYKVYTPATLAKAIKDALKAWCKPSESPYSAWQVDSQLYNDVRRFQTGALPEQPAMVTCQFDYRTTSEGLILDKTLESIELTFWSSKNPFVSDRMVIKPNVNLALAELEVLIAAFARRVESRCIHPRYTHQHKIAQCCNSYKCCDCGEVFVIDSSD